jgi:hypothetical protein
MCGEKLSKSFAYVMLFLSVVFWSGSAKADTAADNSANTMYKFVQMQCDPPSNSVTILPYFDSTKSGKTLTKDPPKDLYPLGERTDQPKEISVTCNLGNRQTVMLIARLSTRPEYDDMKVVLNGKMLNDAYSLARQWSMYIKLTSIYEYDITVCPHTVLNTSDLSQQDYEDSVERDRCNTFHVRSYIL